MKKLMKSMLGNITQFKTVEFVIIKNNDDKETIATGIDVNKSMMITANMGNIPEFDTMMCLGNLQFLSRLYDQDQFMDDKGKMDLIAGESFQGDDIYMGITFKGSRLSAKYNAVDPKVVQTRSRITKFPPVINEMPSDLAFDVGTDLATDFKQASILQKMMATKNTAQVHVAIEDGNLLFRFPYNGNAVDLIMMTDVSDQIASDLRFDAEKLQMIVSSMLNYENGRISIGSSFLDIKYRGDDIDYHIRLPKKVVIS